VKYLILDARYEKMRHGGVVRDAAVLSAIGIGPPSSTVNRVSD
jgi:transposase-like protein